MASGSGYLFGVGKGIYAVFKSLELGIKLTGLYRVLGPV